MRIAVAGDSGRGCVYAEAERQRTSLHQLLRGANKAWHGAKLSQPDWRACSYSIAFTAEIRQEQLLFRLILNTFWEPLDFELPPVHKEGRSCGRSET